MHEDASLFKKKRAKTRWHEANNVNILALAMSIKASTKSAVDIHLFAISPAETHTAITAIGDDNNACNKINDMWGDAHNCATMAPAASTGSAEKAWKRTPARREKKRGENGRNCRLQMSTHGD